MFTAILRSAALRWLAVPIAAGLGYGFYEYENPPASVSQAADAKASPKSPSKLHLTMTVKSAKQLDSGFTILNDSDDYSSPSTQTIVCNKDVLPKGNEDGVSLIGKTITAEGRSATYKGRQQLRASKITVK